MATKTNSSAKSPQATSRSNRDSMRWILGLCCFAFRGAFPDGFGAVLRFRLAGRHEPCVRCRTGGSPPGRPVGCDRRIPGGYAGALVGRASGGAFVRPVRYHLAPDRHDGRSARIIRQRPLLFNHSVLGALLDPRFAGFPYVGLRLLAVRSGPFSAAGGAVPSGSQVARRLTSVIGVLGNIILLLGAWIL